MDENSVSAPQKRDVAGGVMAVVLVLGGLAAVGFGIYYIGDILQLVLRVLAGFVAAFGLSYLLGDRLERFGSHPLVDNKWAWLALFAVMAVLVYWQGLYGVTLAAWLFFLRAFARPLSPEAKLRWDQRVDAWVRRSLGVPPKEPSGESAAPAHVEQSTTAGDKS